GAAGWVSGVVAGGGGSGGAVPPAGPLAGLQAARATHSSAAVIEAAQCASVPWLAEMPSREKWRMRRTSGVLAAAGSKTSVAIREAAATFPPTDARRDGRPERERIS